MKFTAKVTSLSILGSLFPIMAHADCTKIFNGIVTCDATDLDGYVSDEDGETVQVIGSVSSLDDGLFLFGNGPVVTNFGNILGLNNGIVAPINLELSNLGTIEAVVGTGVATVSGAHIENTLGTITGTAGEAISSESGLNLVNSNGIIEGLGSAPTVVAGQDATIQNILGGTIRGALGPAVRASTGLIVENATNSLISSTREIAIEAGSSASITNEGTIRSTSDSAVSALTGLVLKNGPLSLISSTSGVAIETGATASVTNLGMIDGQSGGVSLGVLSHLTNQSGGTIRSVLGPSVEGGRSVVITNEIAGKIEGGAFSPAISLREADGSQVLNRGQISTQGDEVLDFSASGILTLDNRTTGEIENLSGDGVMIRGARMNLQNAGLIRTQGVAIWQTGGTLDLNNHSDGMVVSDEQVGVWAENARIINGSRATIQGEQSAIRLSTGSVQNEGLIEASNLSGSTPADGTAIFVERSAEDVTVTNRGEISGAVGIQFDVQHAGERRIINAGRIAAQTGPAIDFFSDFGESRLALQDDSEIFGDVIFGGSNDELRLFDISSDHLISGLFDGGAGTDSLVFSDSYAWSDFLSFSFADPITMDITFQTERGDSLFGTFRNFELIQIAGVERSFEELRAATISAVPLPAALPMLLAGLGALGLFARRRR